MTDSGKRKPWYLENLQLAIQVVSVSQSVRSDGPSMQFKNKFIAASIPALEQKHHLKIKWNYFVTSKGKGPVNRNGCSTKPFVWKKVSFHKRIVVVNCVKILLVPALYRPTTAAQFL